MRVTRLGLPALLIGSVLFLIPVEPAVAVDNVVLQWNEATLGAIRNTKTSPPSSVETTAAREACEVRLSGISLSSNRLVSSQIIAGADAECRVRRRFCSGRSITACPLTGSIAPVSGFVRRSKNLDTGFSEKYPEYVYGDGMGAEVSVSEELLEKNTTAAIELVGWLAEELRRRELASVSETKGAQ